MKFDAETYDDADDDHLDDTLLETAQRLSGIEERSALLREALKALIEREAGRRLARLGGSQPDLEMPIRRRPG